MAFYGQANKNAKDGNGTQGRNPPQEPKKRFYKKKFATMNTMIRKYDRNEGD